MLNLLIALMGDSYAQVAENGMSEWRLEQTKLILANEYATSMVERACDGVVFFQHRKGTSSVYMCASQDDSLGDEKTCEEEDDNIMTKIVLQQQQLQETMNKIMNRLDQKD